MEGTNNLNFKAIHIARTQNIAKKSAPIIDIYKLTGKDAKFLNELREQKNFKELMPELTEYDANRWQKVFEYGIDSAQIPYYNSYLAVSENKPCGLLVLEELGPQRLILDCICKIPTKKSTTTKGAGEALFTQMFKYADEKSAKSIDLKAVTDGPFDVVKKYENLGFLNIGWDEMYVHMSCHKFKIKEQLKKLLAQISYKPTKTSENVNLDYLL